MLLSSLGLSDDGRPESRPCGRVMDPDLSLHLRFVSLCIKKESPAASDSCTSIHRRASCNINANCNINAILSFFCSCFGPTIRWVTRDLGRMPLSSALISMLSYTKALRFIAERLEHSDVRRADPTAAAYHPHARRLHPLPGIPEQHLVRQVVELPVWHLERPMIRVSAEWT